MTTAPPEHPTPEQLSAFGLGRLEESASAVVEAHLTVCEPCRTVVESLPDDSLIALVQAPPGDSTCTGAAVPTAAPLGGPPELAEHPRYRVRELLGVGGMGAVYRAEHLLMERPVALKVINRSLTDRPALVERFRREVKAAARLAHPNIVTAFDAEQAGDTHFLVMEYVEGTSLARVLAERGPLPVAEACAYARQAALGLQHAHEQGMVHRDIKPHNLMLTPGGRVKILDFGLARFASEAALPGALLAEPPAGPTTPAASLTQTGTVVGTPDYIAPEQARDAHAADIRADLYSLGCTLYDLLTGRAPFPEGTAVEKVRAHLERAPRPLTELRGDVPAALARVVAKLLAKDPARRYQTPAEVAAALAPFAGSERPRRRARRLAAAALLFVAALAAGVVLYVQTDRGELILEADDQVALTVNKAGVKVRDPDSNREYLLQVGRRDLRTGEYQVEVAELPKGLEFSARHFTLKRGGQVTLTVRVRVKKDEELLQGTWRPVSVEFQGRPIFDDVKVPAPASLTFKEDRVRWNLNPASPLAAVVAALHPNGIFHLHADRKPKAIDLSVLGKVGKTLLGIYRLEGDTLTVCMCGDPTSPEDRPTEFATRPGRVIGLMVLKREPDKTDQELLQGTWRVVAGERDGRPVPEEILKRADGVLTFTGDKVRVRMQESEITPPRDRQARLYLDPTKEPKAIDLIALGGAVDAFVGIYRLDGDTLTLCGYMEPNERTERPTAFATKPGDGRRLIILRRQPASPP
jgi:uncharacterized protein (TIGR03067 family)